MKETVKTYSSSSRQNCQR